MRFTLFTVVSLISSASAVGNAIVKNNSPNTFYVWSVGGSVGDRQTVAPGGNYSEPFRRDPTTGGIALKITKTDDGLWTSAPTQIFSYSLDGAQVVTSNGGGTIDWPSGSNPGGSQVKVSSNNNNVVFTAGA